MPCVLWVRGNFDPDLFLADSTWDADAVWHPGATRWKGPPAVDAGFSVVVSDAGFDEFGVQVREATAFLREWGPEFGRLAGYPGVAGAELSFGVAQRDRAAWALDLPVGLIALAGAVGVAIQIMLYAVEATDGTDT